MPTPTCLRALALAFSLTLALGCGNNSGSGTSDNSATNADVADFDGSLGVATTNPGDITAFYKLLKEADDPAALLKKYPDAVTASSFVGTTLLHQAAAFSDAESVQALLDAGCDPHATGRDGHTPLHDVAYPRYEVEDEQERLRTIRLLLQAGADPNAFAPSGTPTGKARARSCSLQIEDEAIQILIDAGGDPDGIPDSVETFTLSVGMPLEQALEHMRTGEYEQQFPPAQMLQAIVWDRNNFVGDCFYSGLYGSWVMLHAEPADDTAGESPSITAITVWHIFGRVGNDVPAQYPDTLELPRDSSDKHSRLADAAWFSQL